MKVTRLGQAGLLFETGYIKAIKAPLSHIKLLAVGGVGRIKSHIR